MLRRRPRDFWPERAAGWIMLKMRLCAGLALSVAGALALVPGAQATTYCNEPSTAAAPECTPVESPQKALEAAAAHPGFDTVVLGAATYDVGGGLAYSDGGDAANGLRIESRMRCQNRFTCNTSTLHGGVPGTAVLSLSAPGGADVSIDGVILQSFGGATGLLLGPGARARGVRMHTPGAVGISTEGTASLPALVTGGSSVSGTPAIDAPGYGVVEDSNLYGDVGARVRGDGNLDIRGGTIDGFTGVTGPRVRLTGTAITFAHARTDATGTPIGVDVGCPNADSADASGDLTNVTIVGKGQPGATGIRAAGAGGDGGSCDATVRVSSTLVHDADVSLDARGEAGSGTDPRDGHASIEPAYSSFRLAATRVTGPAEIEASSPGNLDADPRLWSPSIVFYPLLWNSPLIDAGDPASPDEWQRPYIQVVNGRRDIGEFEYGFRRPKLAPSVYPEPVSTRTQVYMFAGAQDDDPGDDLKLEWTLPDGSRSAESSLRPKFDRLGRYGFHVRATDPTGQVAETTIFVRVIRQRISDLRMRPAVFRAAKRRLGSRRAQIRFRAAAGGKLRFRAERATRRSARSKIRWRRVRGRLDFDIIATGTLENRITFTGWLGQHRLRPGLYRLVAKPLSEGRVARARFRVVR